MNDLLRQRLPLPVAKMAETPSWPANRPHDEFGVSPIDTIRCFLIQQSQAYKNPGHWSAIFTVHDPHLHSHIWTAESANLFFLSTEFTDFDPQTIFKALEWHPDELGLSAIALFSTGELDALNLELISAENSEPAGQLSFPLKGEFSPSKELVELWASSVKSYARDARLAKLNIALNPSEFELQQEFAKMLKSTLATVAQAVRYDGSEDISITQDCRFTSRLQVELCEQFLVGAYESSSFLTLLSQELRLAVTHGTKIQGGWGYITNDSRGDLIFKLNKPKQIADKSFVRAIRIE